MSIVLYVFIHDSRLPTRDQWQQVLDNKGTALVLDDFEPRRLHGFLPAKLNDQECGFEYSFQPITVDDFEEILEEIPEIGDRNRVVTLRWHASELDMRAGNIAAAALAALTDGIYLDPQGGGYARGEDVYRLFSEEEIRHRETRMLRAIEKWAQITTRRCPQCGAPCPEYKAKCAVCEFEIGRSIS